ncbi:hypothetical protein WA026_007066 [Henosepilachna vigintioctopunctata]|uniref:Uncharacterized protein n=1 Tax=Henosepilachna vigintioctopunctata TaxID=420089 RepID=A0AAW1VAC0_9CUCU
MAFIADEKTQGETLLGKFNVDTIWQIRGIMYPVGRGKESGEDERKNSTQKSSSQECSLLKCEVKVENLNEALLLLRKPALLALISWCEAFLLAPVGGAYNYQYLSY